MKNHGAFSKLVYTAVVFCLLASFMVLGCSPQATPTPTATPKPTPTPTATAVKPTPTPTSTASSQPQHGGTLRIGFRAEADSLGYPAKVVNSFYTVLQAGPALETLLRTDTTGNQIPWLGTAFKADAATKTITFTLRKGVKFHDGTDFNATAVKWNIDQLIAAKTASASLIGSVDVVDDYTVRINLTVWSSLVLGQFDQTAGLMVSPAAFQTNGVDWSVKHPIGTGPFKFVSWSAGVGISYQKFDGYWQSGEPYLDGVQIVFITDDITREVSFRAGEIDVAHALISTNLTKLKSDGFVTITRPATPSANSFVPDSANPKSPFADVRVRQAAAYAIDNVSLTKSVYGDLGATATNQLTWPGYWAYDPTIVGYPYDPAKAKQLLTAAGYPNGFQTTIMASSGVPAQQTYATGVQSYFKAVGIDVAVNSVASAQVQALAVTGATWQGLVPTKNSTDPDWVSGFSAYYNGNGSYVDMLLPDDYSQAIKDAITAPDFATKQKLAQQANKLAIDKYCLMIPQYSVIDNQVLWSYVQGTGLFQTVDTIIWTPETAWLGKH